MALERSTVELEYASVAQGTEQVPSNHLVAGSSPAGGATNLDCGFWILDWGDSAARSPFSSEHRSGLESVGLLLVEVKHPGLDSGVA